MKSMEIFKFHAFLLKNKNYHLVLISTYSYALKKIILLIKEKTIYNISR